MPHRKLPLLVLLGPTAVGKTELSLKLAEELGTDIISGDSMCLYRGFDIGSAKPTPEEQARVRHHLIDVLDADEPFSVTALLSYMRMRQRAVCRLSSAEPGSISRHSSRGMTSARRGNAAPFAARWRGLQRGAAMSGCMRF